MRLAYDFSYAYVVRVLTRWSYGLSIKSFPSLFVEIEPSKGLMLLTNLG